jgi:hypothetical protein
MKENCFFFASLKPAKKWVWFGSAPKCQDPQHWSPVAYLFCGQVESAGINNPMIFAFWVTILKDGHPVFAGCVGRDSQAADRLDEVPRVSATAACCSAHSSLVCRVTFPTLRAETAQEIRRCATIPHLQCKSENYNAILSVDVVLISPFEPILKQISCSNHFFETFSSINVHSF